MDSSTIVLLVVLAVLVLVAMALSGARRGAVLAGVVVVLMTAAVPFIALAQNVFPGLVGGTSSTPEVAR